MSRSRFTMPLAGAALLAIAAAGCTGALAGRSGARHTPALRLFTQLPPGYAARFTIDDAHSSRSLGTAMFRQEQGETAPHSPWESLPDGSPVVVQVTLLGDGDAPLASGSIRIPRVERDWFYEARVQVVRFIPGVPMVPCMGCHGEARFPVHEGAGLTANDSLVVTWSARHVTRPMPPA